MKVRAEVIPSGNATDVEISADVTKAMDPGPQPTITATVHGHSAGFTTPTSVGG